MTRRVGVIGMWHETNTFSSTPTTLANYESFELLSGQALAEHNVGTGTVIGGFYDSTELELVPVFSAGAWPSGPTEAEAIQHLFERIDDGLRKSGQLDGVLINLHGAMVATGTDDVEAATLAIVRDVAGDIPVGAVLDLHANPSLALADACSVMVSYDTYPHVDMRERGAEVAALLSRVLDGRPMHTTLGKIPLLVCPIAQATAGGPMRELQDAATARGKDAGVERVSVVGGFAYSDVERAGMSVLVVHDADAGDVAQEVVDATIADIASRAGDFAVVRDDARTAVARAQASMRRPVFLADVADNIGGGSPGDGTELLREILLAKVTGAVVTLADREVALECSRLGVGQHIDMLVGGKTDRHHGAPIRIRGTIERLTDGAYRASGYYMGGRTFSMGRTAVLSVEGNTLVVTERPTPPFHPEQLSSVGVDVTAASMVVVKGAIAWRGAYESVAGEIIEVATPGICPVDVSSLPRRTVPMSL